MKKKVVVIVGQTSTGKSALAIRVAKKFGGEIIIADSRQIYKGLDLGSGKTTKDEMKGVPHHLQDIADPMRHFSVFEYTKLAEEKIEEVLDRNKLPIIVGGTGFYVDALTRGTVLPRVPPNSQLRKKLKKKSAAELFAELKRIDPARAATIDAKNKVRLVRAIEIAGALGWVPKLRMGIPKFKFVKIGLTFPDRMLKKRIRARLRQRLRKGMAVELRRLHEEGVPWKRFEELGFDQRFIALYLQGKLTEKEIFPKLLQKNWQYAKRQFAWFKRDEEIKWFAPPQFPKIMDYLHEALS
ncbi:MAG: tRNA (adenosine(37)-N6)-dimethylallyltransferase MiaA [Patescibacteria group bacterium]